MSTLPNATLRTDAMIRLRRSAGRASQAPRARASETRPPLLDAETERALIIAWKQHGDRQALDRLVRSYQALVTRVAGQYRLGSVPFADLVSEGNVGLMYAIEKFDVERGFRLSTYAVWWIRATISELALAGSSLVKGVTNERHRRILFNLRRIKARLGDLAAGDLSPEATATIAEELGVAEADVTHVNGWATAREMSLNVGPGDEESRTDWQETLIDPADDPETAVISDDEHRKRQHMVRSALTTLDTREQHIIARRHLAEEPEKLVDISRRFGVSRERVRQIEARALAKLRRRVAAMGAAGDAASGDPVANGLR